MIKILAILVSIITVLLFIYLLIEVFSNKDLEKFYKVKKKDIED